MTYEPEEAERVQASAAVVATCNGEHETSEQETLCEEAQSLAKRQLSKEDVARGSTRV